jgi:hypothetical protein
MLIPGAVCVFDAQYKSAIVLAGEEPIEQRRPGSSHVEVAGGAGGEANAHFGGHFLVYSFVRLYRRADFSYVNSSFALCAAVFSPNSIVQLRDAADTGQISTPCSRNLVFSRDFLRFVTLTGRKLTLA